MQTNSARIWGVFNPGDGTAHVAPVGVDARVLHPHTLDMQCVCNPSVGDDRIIRHEEIQ
jgi:hypothetical protein